MIVILYGKLPITVVNQIYDFKNFLHNSYVCYYLCVGMWYENCKNPPYKNLMCILLAYNADRNKDYWYCLRSFSYAGTTLLRVVAKCFLSPLVLPSLFLVHLPPTALPVVIYSLLPLALVPIESSCICGWLCCLSWSNRWPNWPSSKHRCFSG